MKVIGGVKRKKGNKPEWKIERTLAKPTDHLKIDFYTFNQINAYVSSQSTDTKTEASEDPHQWAILNRGKGVDHVYNALPRLPYEAKSH